MATRKKNTRNSNKGNSSLGVLFWIACILLVLVIFLFNRQNIQRVLQNTQLLEVITQNLEVDEPRVTIVSPETEDSESIPTVPVVPVAPPVQPPENEPEPPRETPQQPPIETPPQPSDPVTTPETTGPPTTTENEDVPSGSVSATKVRTFPLYFVKIRDDGEVILESLPRGIRFVDSPLTATLQALLAGPVPSESNLGYLSVIPENSQLISASIRNETAYLNFNETFRFNPLGGEGQKAQLKQIIYTATEFPTVNQVQLLIEGQVVQYLGGDGLFVGAPLQRGSF